MPAPEVRDLARRVIDQIVPKPRDGTRRGPADDPPRTWRSDPESMAALADDLATAIETERIGWAELRTDVGKRRVRDLAREVYGRRLHDDVADRDVDRDPRGQLAIVELGTLIERAIRTAKFPQSQASDVPQGGALIRAGGDLFGDYVRVLRRVCKGDLDAVNEAIDELIDERWLYLTIYIRVRRKIEKPARLTWIVQGSANRKVWDELKKQRQHLHASLDAQVSPGGGAAEGDRPSLGDTIPSRELWSNPEATALNAKGLEDALVELLHMVLTGQLMARDFVIFLLRLLPPPARDGAQLDHPKWEVAANRIVADTFDVWRRDPDEIIVFLEQQIGFAPEDVRRVAEQLKPALEHLPVVIESTQVRQWRIRASQRLKRKAPEFRQHLGDH